jgi:hypothetical protein
MLIPKAEQMAAAYAVIIRQKTRNAVVQLDIPY